MPLPESFVSRLYREWPQYAEQIVKAIEEGDAATSVRYNGADEERKLLPEAGLVQWSRGAIYLSERPSFTLDPAFHAGNYYVQEASSMLYDAVLQKLPAAKCALDLCAAPGGKSLILADHLRTDGFLLSNEFIPKRAEVLLENLNKWGNSRIMLSNASSAELLATGLQFDLIAVDAPCSGEGMFRKDREAVRLWHEDLPQHCRNMQDDILNAALPMLEAGGHLIYSTCTFGYLENEAIYLRLVQQGLEAVQLDFPEEWGLIDAHVQYPDIRKGTAYHAFPGYTRGEGFFVCAFQKKSTPGQTPSTANSAYPVPEEMQLEGLVTSSPLGCYKFKNQLFTATQSQAATAMHVVKHLKILRLGGEVGQEKGGHFRAAHALALSRDVKFGTEYLDLPQAQALWYLARKDFQPKARHQGLVKVRCEGFVLGWGMFNQNKYINLFPAQYKIRMDLPKRQ
jgi:16S rRNA C967 or C1407 C5-methylase (RsmB/RsmF family)/NOL1/NOP2/fmu family ribosome biogenesis protein